MTTRFDHGKYWLLLFFCTGMAWSCENDEDDGNRNCVWNPESGALECLGALGEACMGGGDCASGACASTPRGNICVDRCDAVNPCPRGFQCQGSSAGSFCMPVEDAPRARDPDGKLCRAPAEATGTYILAVLTALDPGKPLLLKAEVVTDLESEPNTIQMVLQPLGVEDRTPLGDIIAPEAVEIGEDGRFSIPFGNVVITGEANPISGSEIEADLTLNGEIRGEQDICGLIEGELIRPTAFSLNGSTVGMGLVEGDDFASATPVLECAACPGESF